MFGAGAGAGAGGGIVVSAELFTGSWQPIKAALTYSLTCFFSSSSSSYLLHYYQLTPSPYYYLTSL